MVKMTNKKREWLNGYMFISLWLIGYVIFTLVPVIQSLNYSLNEATFAGNTIKMKFIAFDNYRYAFLTDTRFPTLLVEYFRSMLISVPLSIVFALIIAMLINQKIKCRGLFRTIFFLPVIISTGPVINELTSQGASSIPLLRNEQIINFVREILPPYLASPIINLFGSIIMVLWFSGIPILIFLAGLQKIDKSIYEAASIDGASPWESFWKVTLPAIKPFIMVNIVFMIVTLSAFTDHSENSIIYYIQEQTGYTGNVNVRGYGYASALGVIYFGAIISQILVYIGLLNIKRD